ncbi:MAG: WhiB family transcriptional regulator [Propionicimonas sp.]|uniref:sigma factor-like helix-turn-helix DNA-binding protein n=1 Tax=Propionicimonas sp. TaxID=1955623 RepID=UPI002B20498F|nr:sigma factor-like helix-turn-helix DNA-binding protein [Propionicimonas sp.]MEA4945475.1 WhiB family transcriptional regulator [Propionicimonas sp.]MEA5054605.1 WhiB family transcriptional regulator [Propionicimonas sp.]MEA5117793.1 WhiB family transcriptional regulator [Propionicimonas sp.]
MPEHAALCINSPEVFQHPFVEEPALARDPANQLEAHRLIAKAATLCADCPLFERCLYAAVVEHDVAGVAAGTTSAQRLRIRRLLGVRPEPEDLGDFAGTSREGSRLSHNEVLRLRKANPDASLETIAERLGCSLSTVKRHLRRARNEGAVNVAAAVPVRPPLTEVLSAHAVVVGRGTRARVA